jgi:translation initiation factor IF-1
MVRNTTGGNGNKKFARKHAEGGASKAGNKLRISENEGELYAVTTKNLGNNMFHAVAADGIKYLVHIRGKFSGRGRRDNTIADGVWVLIGLRPWTNNDQSGQKKKLQQCDLLEVYTEQDKIRLKDTVVEDWDVLNANDPKIIDKKDIKQEENIHWLSDKDIEQAKLLEEIKSGTTAKIKLAAEETTSTEDPEKAPVFDMEVYINEI